MSEHESRPPAKPPHGAQWSPIMALVWVVIQIAVPLSYYVAGREFDERFAWRMFSDVRQVRCANVWLEGGRPVPAERRVHVAWASLMQRQRGDVIDAYVEHRCAALAPNADLRLHTACRFPDEERVLRDGSVDLCAEGAP